MAVADKKNHVFRKQPLSKPEGPAFSDVRPTKISVSEHERLGLSFHTAMKVNQAGKIVAKRQRRSIRDVEMCPLETISRRGREMSIEVRRDNPDIRRLPEQRHQ